MKAAKAAPQWAGDVWTWTAIDADTKLMVSYMVGDRSAQAASEFMHDVAYSPDLSHPRLAARPCRRAFCCPDSGVAFHL